MRSRRHDAAVVGSLVGLLVGCGPGPLVRRGILNRPLVDLVATDVSTFRGLPMLRPVPAQAANREEMAAFFREEVGASFLPGDLARVEAVNRHLGVLAPAQHLDSMMGRLYEQQVAGFYDPRRKTFTVATDAPNRDGVLVGILSALTGHYPVAELLVAHELTHALQDQYFGIPITPEPLLHSHSDRLLAQRALFEGDATLAGFAQLYGGRLEQSAIDRILDALGGLPNQLAHDLPDVPPLLRAPLAFQYEHGTRFAARALQVGGWPAIDRAHRAPPESSEQVLHPERYFDQLDPPTAVVIDDRSVPAATGWYPVLEDTMGELGVRVLLDRLGTSAAEHAAAGWGGDRLRAYQRGEEIVSLWLTAWDDEEPATKFSEAIGQAWPGARVSRRGRVVLVAKPDPAVVVDLGPWLTAVWTASTVNGLRTRGALTAPAPAPSADGPAVDMHESRRGIVPDTASLQR